MKKKLFDEVTWPESELEPVHRCPVCESSSRILLYKELIDNVAFCAPGKWRMQQCLDCGAAYLDPRPSPASLHVAYKSYHTHVQTIKQPEPQRTWFYSLRHGWANGYRNWRYGTQYLPSSRLGVLAAYLFPGMRKSLDLPFRYLPRAWPGARVLDVGLGNGDFLEAVRGIGWDVAGVDMDPVVVKNAMVRGLDVRLGGIAVFADQPESFDAITISHVIEHVYDPIETLSMAYKLLKPGGLLWIDTPNVGSFGHSHFGEHWRGLEAPRHLVLFGRQSMNYALNRSGFRDWEYISRTAETLGMFMASERIRLAMKPDDQAYLKTSLSFRVFSSAVKLLRSKAEFITVIARKAER